MSTPPLPPSPARPAQRSSANCAIIGGLIGGIFFLLLICVCIGGYALRTILPPLIAPSPISSTWTPTTRVTSPTRAIPTTVTPWLTYTWTPSIPPSPTNTWTPIRPRTFTPIPTRTLSPTPQIKTCGPYGTNAGDAFNETFKDPLTGMVFRTGNWIDAIQMIYGTSSSDRHGGSGGGDSQEISFDQGEYIQGIEIRAALYVDAITIYTNLRTFGPFGGSGGTLHPMCGGSGWQLIGIFGRSGLYLNTLGVTFQRR